jgi:hypothetical protein
MLVKINGIDYNVNDDEFAKIPHDRYQNLVIREGVGKFERIISLINEMSHLNIENLIVYNTTHGGFIPINCSPNFQRVIALDTRSDHADNAATNVKNRKIKNVTFDKDIQPMPNNTIVYSENDTVLDMDFIKENKPVVLTPYSNSINDSEIYNAAFQLTNSNLILYITDRLLRAFN